MLFILLTGIVGLLAAFHFALRAKRQSLGFIKMMGAATLFGTLAASCADVGATLAAGERAFSHTGHGAEPRAEEETPVDVESKNLPRAFHIMTEGLAESTSPGILGFSFLAMSSMLVAVGRRRMDERAAAEKA